MWRELWCFWPPNGCNVAHATRLMLRVALSMHNDLSDPTIFCTAAKKSRFFLFSKREPEEEGQMDVGQSLCIIDDCRSTFLSDFLLKANSYDECLRP